MTLIAIDVKNGTMIADRASFTDGCLRETHIEKIFRVTIRGVPVVCAFTGNFSDIPNLLSFLTGCCPAGQPDPERARAYKKILKGSGTLFTLCETVRLKEAFGFELPENEKVVYAGAKYSLIVTNVSEDDDSEDTSDNILALSYVSFHSSISSADVFFRSKLSSSLARSEIVLQEAMAELHREGYDYVGFGWIVDSLERQTRGDYPILVKLPYRFSESEPVLPKIE